NGPHNHVGIVRVVSRHLGETAWQIASPRKYPGFGETCVLMVSAHDPAQAEKETAMNSNFRYAGTMKPARRAVLSSPTGCVIALE
ncbi:MAG: hypothetical protein ACYTAS_07890, partial [Planctomycetota bacterium]